MIHTAGRIAEPDDGRYPPPAPSHPDPKEVAGVHTHPTSEVWASEELLSATRAGVEIWRPVPVTDKYEVSNQGRARSWAVKGSSRRADAPTILTCNPQSDGYQVVQIFSGGKRRTILLHNAICEAFIGPRPGHWRSWVAGHHDDDRTNNALTNLKWCTWVANFVDRKRNGRQPYRECREVGGVKHYQCTGCKDWKPADQFRENKSPHSACGRESKCIPCARARECEQARARRAARGAKPRARRAA